MDRLHRLQIASGTAGDTAEDASGGGSSLWAMEREADRSWGCWLENSHGLVRVREAENTMSVYCGD